MDPLLDDDQQDYQQSLRRFFETHWTETQVRSAMDAASPANDAVWQRLAAEMGVAGLMIPEAYGGSGSAVAEALLVAEEMGRALYGGPYLSTVVLAANAIVFSGDEAVASELLPAIAAGELTAALALSEEGRDRADQTPPRAEQVGGVWKVTGTVRRVIDGDSADRLLVEAESGGQHSLFLLEGDEGVERQPSETLDPTRRMATLVLNQAPARLVGKEGGMADITAQLRPVLSLALAAEAVGGADRCVTDTVAYAKVRHQFGRPIGSFQAVKHRCAEMQVRLEGARSGIRRAGQVAVTGEEDLTLLSSVVKVFATTSYFRTAADMVQLHGGIGFTWEHSAHLHFKRAKSLELMGGTAQSHRAVIADAVLQSR